MNLVKKWWKTEAQWWEFWYPNSGLVGGIITGLLILSVWYYFY